MGRHRHARLPQLFEQFLQFRGRSRDTTQRIEELERYLPELVTSLEDVLRDNSNTSNVNANSALLASEGESLPTVSEDLIGRLILQRIVSARSRLWYVADNASGAPTYYEIVPGGTPGDVRNFGAVGDGVTNDTAAVQAAFTAMAGLGPVVFPNLGAFWNVSGRLTAPANTTIVLLNGAEIRWASTSATGSNFLGAATRPGIEVLGNHFHILGDGLLTGPSTASFVAGEIGIFAIGASTSARFEHFRIERGIEFQKWGRSAVTLQFVDFINLDGLHVHDCGYAGAELLSCDEGSAEDVKIYTITPGASGNAYGLSLSHDSTDYDLDDHVDGTIDTNGRLAANPFCRSWRVSGTVWDIPLWQGFDAHGGYEVHFHHMETYNCRHGVAFAGSSGDAIDYAGENNTLDHIFVTTKQRDGSATTVSATDRAGINISGGAAVKNRSVFLHDFVVDGYGDTVVSSQSVKAIFVESARITHGRITNWKGHGIVVGDKGSTGFLEDIELGAVASSTNSECIREEFSTSASNFQYRDVRHRAAGGTVAAEGLRIDASNGSERWMQGCDFSEATTPLTGIAGTLLYRTTDGELPSFVGSGTPESAVTAPIGSQYRRRDGGAGTTLYQKESGTGNTGWVAR